MFSTGVAGALDDSQINSMLAKGGNVVIPAGIHVIRNPLVVPSNTVVSGEVDQNGKLMTVIKLGDHVSWDTFVPLVKVTSSNNVVIQNIEFDVNADNNLDVGASYPNGKAWGHGFYNIIHAIDCDNVIVRNNLMHDGLGDGFRAKSCTNIEFYNNVCYRLGHDVFYGVDTKNIAAHNNRITTRTNSALRLWNSEHARLYNNLIDAQQDSLGGNAAIQIEDSKGSMTDIEVCNNIISHSWGSGIWLISYSAGSSNTQGIYIHHNLLWQPSQTKDIGYAAGITGYGTNGNIIKNNVIDGASSSGFAALSGSRGTIIQDNIITNTVNRLKSPPTGAGYGIVNSAGADLTISSNCFFNNLNGNVLKSTSSNDDLQDPKTHLTSSGWTWTGSTWTCNFVPPMDLGKIDPTETKNTVDKDTHEVMIDIFGILKVEASNTGYVTQKYITPSVNWEDRGKYTGAWIDVPGYENEIRIDNETYIPDKPSKTAIVYYTTRNYAEFPDGQTATKRLTDENGNVLKVDLDVKTNYKIQQKKKTTLLGVTFNKTLYIKKNENVTFTRTFNAPPVFPALKAPKAYVTYYNGSHAIVMVPKVPGIIKVQYYHNDSYAREYRLIGEVGTALNGFRSTTFHKARSWGFNDNQMSEDPDGLYIKAPFDIKKLSINVTTPYAVLPITDFEYTVVEDNSKKVFSYGLLFFLIFVGIYGGAIYSIVMREVRKWI
jgi:hypothetical protein